jgi:hypothetical protein
VYGHVECRLARVPEEVGVVKQGSELVDPFPEPLLGSKLPEQGDDLSQHQKSIAITRIVAALVKGPPNSGKNLLGRRAKDEIEGIELHA